MEENILSFFDENGELLPLEEIQGQVSEIYKVVEEEESKKSTLDDFTSPDGHIKTDEAIETFSFQNRAIFLCSEINQDISVSVCEVIHFWNEIDNQDNVPIEERKPIKIYIDTPGGEMNATFSIIDSIELSKTPVWTITTGAGYSGGFFAGICGHKRIGYPHSSYLFHEGSLTYEGDSHKYLQQADFYKKQLSLLKQITIEKTKIDEREYNMHKKDDLWLTADEALEKGIIDEIATELV